MSTKTVKWRINRMYLKDQKITRWQYIDSNGKFYNIGFGNIFPLKKTENIYSAQVPFVHLFVDNFIYFINSLYKIFLNSIVLYSFLLTLYGTFILLHYQIYYTASLIKVYIYGTIAVGMILLFFGILQQLILKRKVLNKYILSIFQLLTLFYICDFFLKDTIFDFSIVFKVIVYNIILEFIGRIVFFIFNCTKDCYFFRNNHFIWSKNIKKPF